MAIGIGLVPVVLLLLQAWEIWSFSQRRVGLIFQEDGAALVLTDVFPSSPAAEGGLRPGDELLALQGHQLDSEADFDEALDDRKAGGPVTFVVKRGDDSFETTVSPGTPFPAFSFAIEALTALGYFVIGPLALAKRPGYLRARLLFLMTTAVAIELSLPGEIWAFLPWFVGGVLLSGFQMGVELHLASVIPEDQDWLTRFPKAIPTFYAVGVGLAVAASATLVADEAGVALPFDPDAAFTLYATLVPLVWAYSVLLLLGRQAISYPEPTGRRQAATLAIGVLPWALLVTASTSERVWSFVPVQWEEVIWNLGLLGFPVAVLAILWQDASNQERILLDLTDEVRGVRSVPEVSRIVNAELESAFHPQCAHVFYRRRHSRDLTLGHSTVASLEEEIVPEDSALLRLVEGAGREVEYPAQALGLPAAEVEWLDRLRAQLLVPVSGRDDRLLGLLVLGAKKSREPYTPHDRKLLRALAEQIALVYQNVRLEQRVEQSQRVQREVLTRLGEANLALVRECPSCGRCFDADVERCQDDGAELSPTIPVERLVAGRYRLDRAIDRGGMGAIFVATDGQLERQVALKVLSGSFVNEEIVRRFDSEARLTARLRHPSIVTVYDYGTTNSGVPFLALELLEGETLAHRIARGGALPPNELLPIVRDVLAGVAAAHDAGIVHRDLKPANVFLTVGSETAAKILDFGVAKLRRSMVTEQTGLTAPGSMIGTFRYMAPEQIQGRDADELSDLFALGVMILEAVTGIHPFPGETPTEVLRAIEGVRVRAPEIPDRVADVLHGAVAMDPARRPGRVTDFGRELIDAITVWADTEPSDSAPAVT